MKRRNKVALGGLLLMAGLVLAQVPALASDGGRHVACVQFTKNGNPLGDPICSQIANDLNVVFLGRGEVQFTLESTLLGDPQKSTPSANDFEVKWDGDLANGHDFTESRIVQFNWTRDGQTIGSATVPPFANDFHFKTGKIVSVNWTLDDKPIGGIDVPKGANDLEFVIPILVAG